MSAVCGRKVQGEREGEILVLLTMICLLEPDLLETAFRSNITDLKKLNKTKLNKRENEEVVKLRCTQESDSSAMAAQLKVMMTKTMLFGDGRSDTVASSRALSVSVCSD